MAFEALKTALSKAISEKAVNWLLGKYRTVFLEMKNSLDAGEFTTGGGGGSSPPLSYSTLAAWGYKFSDLKAVVGSKGAGVIAGNLSAFVFTGAITLAEVYIWFNRSAMPTASYLHYVNADKFAPNQDCLLKLTYYSNTYVEGEWIINKVPEVLSAIILGDASAIGNVLTLDHVYYDYENDLEDTANHQYQWYRSNTDGSSRAAISGATTKTYTLVLADSGKRLDCEVKLAALSGESPSATFTTAYVTAASFSSYGSNLYPESYGQNLVDTNSNGRANVGTSEYTNDSGTITATIAFSIVAAANGGAYAAQRVECTATGGASDKIAIRLRTTGGTAQMKMSTIYKVSLKYRGTKNGGSSAIQIRGAGSAVFTPNQTLADNTGNFQTVTFETTFGGDSVNRDLQIVISNVVAGAFFEFFDVSVQEKLS